MYGLHPLADATRAAKAILTNQIARFSPRLYVNLVGETGRGYAEERPQDVATYFRECFRDYFSVLGIAPEHIDEFLSGKRIVEYGPGDILGMALLLVAHGCEKVTCVDRFPLLSYSEKNAAILQDLLDGLDEEARERAAACFTVPGKPASGLRDGPIDYVNSTDGFCGLDDQVDLIFSRAVLEHVNDLPGSFADMQRALVAGGRMVHQIDLKSHGLHRQNPLDFLTWPPGLWGMMYSHKGVPNRCRVSDYRRALATSGFVKFRMQPINQAPKEVIDTVRPHLATPFRSMSDEDLSWLEFWLVADKPS